MDQKKGKRRVASKLCVRCGAVLPLTEFYSNKGWASQSYHDAWCKECATKFCKDMETLREYCWYNCRRWADEFYEIAGKKALYTLANQDDYLKASRAKKKLLEDQATCRQFFSVMNLSNFYCYSDNIGKEGEYRMFDPASQDGTVDVQNQPRDNGELIYDKTWNGMYTAREVAYLNDYYARLEEDFVLDNESIRDYARKAAKASLDADIKYNKMRQGQASANDWKEAQAVFDNLSKSANFAACKRKPGDNAGLGALGLIIQKIEQSGALQKDPVSFPPDDIDRIVNDFRHTIAAVGLDTMA